MDDMPVRPLQELETAYEKLLRLERIGLGICDFTEKGFHEHSQLDVENYVSSCVATCGTQPNENPFPVQGDKSGERSDA
jgi:hypothetical protein